MDDNQNSQNQSNTVAPGPAPVESPVPAPVDQAAPSEQPAPAQSSAPEPAKAPTNPKTKKIIILVSIIAGSIVILAVLAIILLPIILRVDYSESYNTAKELNEKINKLAYSSDCSSVTSYYDSGYTSNKTFNAYAENCLAVTEGLADLVEKLGTTDGVRRNSDIQNVYNGFKAAFDKLAIDSSSLASKLDTYKTWHAFVVADYDLDELSNDSSYNTAGNILVESSNETLKEYGTKWLEYALAYARAYRAYYNASYGDKDYSEKRDLMKNKREEFENFVSSNEPDIESIAPINMENSEAVATRFADLYRGIANTYAKNYNKGSGDCEEFMNEVYCPYN